MQHKIQKHKSYITYILVDKGQTAIGVYIAKPEEM